MYIVAIHNLPGKKEQLAEALATALGTTTLESLARLRVPGSGPLVVSVLSDPERGKDVAAHLKDHGFETIALTEEDFASLRERFCVRWFSFGDHSLHVRSRNEASLDVDYGSVDLIVRGNRREFSSEMRTEKKRTFSPGRALLSGGLVFSKTTRSSSEDVREKREGFLHVRTAAGSLLFPEGDLVFEGLRSLMQSSRMANFNVLVTELRNRCPGARYDDRLLNRGAQSFMLGPLLTPDEHLDIAVLLLVKAIHGGAH